MKKLRLEIDNLHVESFEVSEEAQHSGTVIGHLPTRGYCSLGAGEGCVGSGFLNSCDATQCDNQSCVVLCPYTYYCENPSADQYSCLLTCGVCNPTENEAGTCQLVTCQQPC